MSQEKLAQPDFTKSYISAIERGKARPSLKALALLAGRLELPITTLLAAPVPDVAEPDLAALDEDLAYQLDHAKLLLSQQQGEAALQLLNTAEAEYRPYLEDLSVLTRYRLRRLRGFAYVRVGDPGSARHELEQAMTLARQLDDPQEIERVRNALGAAYYEQDLPEQALELHRQGLEAIQAGVVKDLNLQLGIYTNLANAYWALNNPQRAISTYHEALRLLNDVNNLERQAGIFWGLSLAYKAAADLDRAKLFAARALGIYEVVENRNALAEMLTNLGMIMADREEYDQAEQQFARAVSLLEDTDQPLALSAVYEHYATLELGRDRLDAAAEHAARSRELIAPRIEGRKAGRGGDALAKANALRTYARALAVSGRVAERRGDRQEADTLFSRALEAIGQTGYAETASEIELTYADVLTARGAHAEASQHYRTAARFRPRHRGR